MQPKQQTHCEPPPKSPTEKKLRVPLSGYIALFVGLIFFSGLFANASGGWGVLDFNVLSGIYGTMKDTAKATFQGQGGTGARAGFLFAVSLIPTVMFALGVVEVIEHYGGLKAAQRLMNPLLRPFLGLPGCTGLALISSLQSTDAGAGMTKALRDSGQITEKEKTIFSAFQFTAGGAITNYLSVGAALFASLTVPILLPLIVIFIFKFVGANFMRLYLRLFIKDID